MSPMIPEKKKDKPLAIEPITHPRKELLPPIHERGRMYYRGINWQYPVKGIETGWIQDIFSAFNEVKCNFATYRNNSNKISNFENGYDKLAIIQDYMPKIREGIKNGALPEGISSPQALNQYMKNETNAKLLLIYMMFACGRRDVNMLDQSCFFEAYAKKLLNDYVPSEPVKDNQEKLYNIFNVAKEYLSVFASQFEHDIMNYKDYDAISKYNREQAFIYMLICDDQWIKTELRKYETYCRVLAICDGRYKDLICSRFNKEKEKMQKSSTYKDLSTDKEFLDAMTLKYEKALANEKMAYNPKYYIQLCHGNKLPIPRDFKFLKNIVDTSLLSKFLKLLDTDNEQYLKYIWDANEDTWTLINGLDRVLNLDNVRYINGKITEYDDNRHFSFYNYSYIQSLDPNSKAKRKSQKSNITSNAVIKNLTINKYLY